MDTIYYLIHSKSFGDTLCATPTLRYLSQSHNQKINVVSHIDEIFDNNPYVNQSLSFDEFYKLEDTNIIKYESFTYAGKQDNNGIEKKFSHIDTRQVHAIDLGFQLMPHQMECDYNPNHVELSYGLPEKYVVCHITQNWANRTWDTKNWQRLIDWLSENKIFTILIGKDHSEKLHDSISIDPLIKACPKLENLYGIDLTNKIGLKEMYQVIKGSSVIITMDTGPLHMAGCTDTHILQIGSAQHPLLRIPYRNNAQNYKYDFVSGTCSIFCNSDLKYNVKEWGHINAVGPLTECSENKPTFECHPHVDKVIDKLREIIKFQEENKYLEFFEILPDNDEDRINFNFKKTINKNIKIEAIDVTTGLKRDKWEGKCEKLENGNYWWSPSPGRLENLGDIDLKFYVDDEYVDKIRISYNGGKKFIINNEELYLDNFDDYNYSTFWEIFIHNEYEFDNKSVVGDGDVVLDIGANFGFFACYAVENNAKKIYAVEPFPTAYENVKKLSEKFPIVPINKAVSSKIDGVTMSLSAGNSATNCLTDYNNIFNNDGEQILVDTININDLINSIDSCINLLKIDCEGSELDVFETITSENLNKISKLVIETHSDYIDNFIRNKLIEHNFKIKNKGNILFATNSSIIL
jgi:FkbM family methyltransferase